MKKNLSFVFKVKENEKLKEQNEFSEQREDYEKTLENLQEKENKIQNLERVHFIYLFQNIILIFFFQEKYDLSKKIEEKDSKINQISLDSLLTTQTLPDLTRLTSLVFDLETRVFPLLSPLIMDTTQSESSLFRLKSFQNELSQFFSFFKEYQKPKLPLKSPKNSTNTPLEAYWKSIVEMISKEKEQLLKKLENNGEIEGLQVRIRELEDSLISKANHQGLNESYWKSLIVTLSSEKEQLLERLEVNTHNGRNENLEEEMNERIGNLEETLQEKNNQIMSFNAIVKEWQAKYEKIEQDIHESGIDNLTKEETFEREVTSLKEQLMINERLLGTREAEILDYCQTLSQRTEKQKFLEGENRKLTTELNEIKLKYSKIEKDLEENISVLANLKEELANVRKNKDLTIVQEQKLLDLNSKFDDFKTKSFDKIENLMQELERI